MRQMLTNIKGEINSNKIILGDFNTPLTSMDKSFRHKVNKNRWLKWHIGPDELKWYL